MKRALGSVSLVFLLLGASPTQTQEPKGKPLVTLTLTKVRGVEDFSTPLEGPMKGQKVRTAVLACDVVLDNQTGEELTVLSRFYSAFDGLHLVLVKDGKELRRQSYLSHQSPFTQQERPFVLKKGKNEKHMRFPISAAPEDWAQLEVKIIGFLPGSQFKGQLTSGTKKIQRVANLKE